MNYSIAEDVNKFTIPSQADGMTVNTDRFYHIVGIIQDNSMNLYIDKTLVGSVSITNPFELNTFFTKNYLGSDLSNNNLFKGTMAYLSKLGWIMVY